MSKEQWGHGFYAGYEKGKQEKDIPKWVIRLTDDNELCFAASILDIHGSTYTMELLDSISISTIWGEGRLFSEKNEDILPENIFEEDTSGWNKEVFYDQRACAERARVLMAEIIKKINAEMGWTK